MGVLPAWNLYVLTGQKACSAQRDIGPIICGAWKHLFVRFVGVSASPSMTLAQVGGYTVTNWTV